MYRALTAQDLPQARTLWEASFNDPASFIDWYFSQRFLPHHVRGLFQDDHLQAMGQLVPYSFAWHGASLPISYLVGLCTQESVRGQGLATQLLRFILGELALKEHSLILLIPALPEFYQDRGWSYVFHHRHDTQISVEHSETPGMLVRGSAPDIAMLDLWYTATFAKAKAYLLRNPKDWRDLLHDHALDGGELWIYISSPGQPEGYLLVGHLQGILLIRELGFSSPIFIETAIELLKKKYPGVALKWQAWPGQEQLGDTTDSEIRPFAMARIVSFPLFIRSCPFLASSETSFDFRLTDPLVETNNGCFRLTIRQGRGELEKFPPSDSLPDTSIQQWVQWLFGAISEAPDPLRQAILPATPYFNDLF